MRRMSVALLVAGVLAAGSAEARTLEDILKEKGVITEADYKEVTKSPVLGYKLGKGFTYNSPTRSSSCLWAGASRRALATSTRTRRPAGTPTSGKSSA